MTALLLLACDGPEVGDYVIEVEQSEAVGAVATVRWNTGEPGVGWVEYGPDETYGHATGADPEPTTEHAIVVVGIPASEEWHLRALTEVRGERQASADTAVLAGPASATLPRFVAEGRRERPGWVATVLFGDRPYAVITDDLGRYVWWYEGEEIEDYVRARMSRDGTSVLVNHFAENRAVDDSSILRISLDGSTVEEVRTEWGHHDFVELPEGGYAYLAIEVRQVGDRKVVGDALREIDPEGTVREVWNAWDWWELPDEPFSEGFYPQGEDWLHCNTLEYDEDRGEYYLSVRNRNSVVRIDRATGALLWELGGEASDFVLTEGTAFEHQHSPIYAGSRLHVFDNREADTRSYARGYEVDEESLSYAETWTWAGPEGNWVSMMGDIEVFDDGTRLMAWGSAGFIDEVDEAGEQSWRMDVEFGNGVGFIQGLTTLGGPRSL